MAGPGIYRHPPQPQQARTLLVQPGPVVAADDPPIGGSPASRQWPVIAASLRDPARAPRNPRVFTLDVGAAAAEDPPLASRAALWATLAGCWERDRPLAWFDWSRRRSLVLAPLPESGTVLTFSWEELVARQTSRLLFSWDELASSPIVLLLFSWDEERPLSPLIFSWDEVPDALAAAHAADQQAPVSQAIKTP